jgi:hypothetical protein
MYTWVLKNNCLEADTLVQIATTAGEETKSKLSLKLFNLITDTTKGIISHYILTSIYYKENLLAGSIFFEDEELIEYYLNGLRFFENSKQAIFADTAELQHNKKVWSVLFRQINLID